MPIIDTPNRPPAIHITLLLPPRLPPAYRNAIAPTPQTIGRIMSNWPSPRGNRSGNSGGDSSSSSPRGSCGPPRRGGRRKMTVLKRTAPRGSIDAAPRRFAIVCTLPSVIDPGSRGRGRRVAGTANSGMSRVTIVAPQTRVDLALPSDIPLADLLPTVLRYAGDGLADDPAGRDGWVLSRLGGAPLAIDRSPMQLDVEDGEMLYLRPRGDEFTEPIFDDVVDAVATSTQDRAGRWRPASTRRFGLTVGVATLAIGAVMVLFSGPPQLPAGIVG